MTNSALRIQIDLTEKNSKPVEAASNVDYWSEATQKIAKGDVRLFAEFYESFFDLMYQEARRLSGRDESFCLDIVQDAMLKAIHSMRQVNSKTHLEAWCKTVVKSVVYDRIRSELARQRRNTEYVDSGDSVEDGSAETDRVIAQARLLWIEEQIELLDPDLKRMFHFRYRLGWSLAKIANKLGIKTGAVDGKIRRALHRIKTKAKSEDR